MKQFLLTIVIIFALLAIFAGIVSPLQASRKQENPSEELSTGEVKVLYTESVYFRVVKERDLISALQYEGHKYLFNHNGGILHAESCPCKTTNPKPRGNNQNETDLSIPDIEHKVR